MAGLGEADLSPPGPPACTKERAPRSRPRLPLKAAPEGAVETDYGLASPGQNLPGVWLPPGNYLRDFAVFLGGAFVADGG
jgi:hypothetical protein